MAFLLSCCTSKHMEESEIVAPAGQLEEGAGPTQEAHPEAFEKHTEESEIVAPAGQLEEGAGPTQEAHPEAFEKYTNKASFLPSLHSGQVALLNPQHLVNLGSQKTPLSRRQELPSKAFVDAEMCSKETIDDIIIISISYGWLSKVHPDPDCYHLELLAAALTKFLRSNYDNAKDYYKFGNYGLPKTKLQKRGWCFGGLGALLVGTFFDFGSLFQSPRSAEQQALFEGALKDINLWYAHQRAIVWMFTTMPTGCNSGYHDRGWPTFERAVSQIISPTFFTLEFNDRVRNLILKEKPAVYQKYGCYPNLVQLAMTNRQGVLSPESFNEIVATKTFTNGADCDAIVKPKYKKTFTAVIQDATTLDFSSSSWGDAEAEQLMHVIKTHCKGVEKLNLSDNPKMQKPLEALAPYLVGLKVIDLSNNMQLKGNISSFCNHISLRELDLFGNFQVVGNISAFAGLVNMTSLSLDMSEPVENPGVQGNISAFSKLVLLTVLRLRYCKVSGNLSSLSTLVNLETLNLSQTNVGGDIKSLAGSTKMRVLDLSYALSIKGSLASLKHWTEIQDFCYRRSGVRFGNISANTKLHSAIREW